MNELKDLEREMQRFRGRLVAAALTATIDATPTYSATYSTAGGWAYITVIGQPNTAFTYSASATGASAMTATVP